MGWRLARSLEVLRAQVNAAYPRRDKTSDGTIGDAAHASRSSDHNPWVKDGATGIVTALDITHDPENGPNAGELAETLRASKDPRIKYIISNKRIVSSTVTGGKPAWAWRKYTGSNPHNKHVHISVVSTKNKYDATDQWDIGGMPAAFVDEPAVNGDHSEPRPQWWKRLWLRWTGGSVGTYLGLAGLSDWQIATVLMGGSVVVLFAFIGLVMAFIGQSGRAVIRNWIVRQFRD